MLLLWFMQLYIATGDKEKDETAAQIMLSKETKMQSTAVVEMRKEAKTIANFKL